MLLSTTLSKHTEMQSLMDFLDLASNDIKAEPNKEASSTNRNRDLVKYCQENKKGFNDILFADEIVQNLQRESLCDYKNNNDANKNVTTSNNCHMPSSRKKKGRNLKREKAIKIENTTKLQPIAAQCGKSQELEVSISKIQIAPQAVDASEIPKHVCGEETSSTADDEWEML